jgi:hypothetical protein
MCLEGKDLIVRGVNAQMQVVDLPISEAHNRHCGCMCLVIVFWGQEVRCSPTYYNDLLYAW